MLVYLAAAWMVLRASTLAGTCVDDSLSTSSGSTYSASDGLNTHQSNTHEGQYHSLTVGHAWAVL